MIFSFGDKKTEDFFHGNNSHLFSGDIIKRAWRKLDILNSANSLEDLKIPPGNKLEKLKGGLSEYHSIRINEKYRIIFIWRGNCANKVSITDYHK